MGGRCLTDSDEKGQACVDCVDACGVCVRNGVLESGGKREISVEWSRDQEEKKDAKKSEITNLAEDVFFSTLLSLLSPTAAVPW